MLLVISALVLANLSLMSVGVFLVSLPHLLWISRVVSPGSGASALLTLRFESTSSALGAVKELRRLRELQPAAGTFTHGGIAHFSPLIILLPISAI
jgi:hypothetical protein